MRDIYETAPEIERRWSDWEPVFGAVRYYRRTANRDYDSRQALEVHFSRWLLMAANVGYVGLLAGIEMAACR